MTELGWIFLSLSWFFIIGLSAFCLYRVMEKKEMD